MKNRFSQHRGSAALTSPFDPSGTARRVRRRFQILPGTGPEACNLEAAAFKPLVCAWVLVLLCAATVRGASLAYEGFDYSGGATLNGQNGGSGFGAPWTADLGIVMQAAGLSSTLGPPSTGLCISGGFDAARQLTSPLNEPEYWVSFLVQANPGNDQVYLGFDVAPSPTPMIAFGRILDTYFIRQGSLPDVRNGLASPVGVTDLLVARFKQSGGATVVQVWVNTLDFTVAPLLSLGVPTVAYTWANMQVQPGLMADEVRIGTSAGDIMGVTLGSSVTGTNLTLSWPQGLLLQAPTPNGPWTTNYNASSPYTTPMTGPQQFYRLILR